MKQSTKSTAKAHGNGLSSETSNAVNSKGSKQDANLRKNGFVHFQIGLILAMLLVYFGLEFAFNKVQPSITSEPIEETALIEFHPEKFIIEKTQVVENAPKKTTNSEDFIIKPNDYQIPETLEFTNDPEETSEPMDVNEIIVPGDDFVDETISFIVVEDVPIFPGCEKVAKSERGACFQSKLQKHIQKNFRYPEIAKETGVDGKVYVMFTIGTEGFIEDVKLRGPAKILENEAARIIDKLPQMTPGKQRLKPVRVSYSIPINFQLQ